VRAIETRTDEAHLLAVLLSENVGTNPGGPRAELIVRTDDGATLSIVETNEFAETNKIRFRAGDRVIILPDGHLHLARPADLVPIRWPIPAG
jgi:hypothetical protein